MRKIRRVFVCSFFISSVFLSLTDARAQEIASYLFLEVTDSSAKPVSDAVIDLTKGYARNARTDENGEARLVLGSYRQTDFTDSLFKVSKSGYFPFQDLGATSESWQTKVKIELLKIPQTKDEQKALGDEQFKREFLWAAKTADADSIRKLLKAGISPNLSTDDLRGVSSPKNIPAILFAAASGDAETIKTLLEAGAKVRRSEEPLRSILIYYLRANPFLKNQSQTKAEKLKSMIAREDGLKRLIKAGADVHARGKSGETTLMVAAENGNISAAGIFLAKGISINATDNSGQTALMHAVEQSWDKNSSQLEMVNFLLKSGAEPNNFVASGGGYCGTTVMIAVYRNSPELIKALIAGKANVNLACENGETALIHAVRNKSVEIVKLLIEAGAEVKGKQGQTALAEAKRQFYPNQIDAQYSREIIRLLEAAGAKPQD